MVGHLFTFHKLVYWIAVVVMVWVFLLYGLPYVRGALPGFCARWDLSGGSCSEHVQGWLQGLDEWSQTHVKPFAKDMRVLWAVREARQATHNLEEVLRGQFGDARVDAAIRGADVAIGRLEEFTAEGRADTRDKLSELSENFRDLLARARASFERLRVLLKSTSRRAEDVSKAVDETQKALEALSNVLPATKK